jgi:DNA-binding MurR/RpiR family transcriptional regulator
MSAAKQIKAIYNTLRPVQKKIADFFLSADFESLYSSIDEIAIKTGTSVASISRFCKNLGFESFQHFKMSFSRDLKYEPDTVLPIFSVDDDPDLSIRKVFSEVMTNLQATEGTVSFSSAVEAAKKILQSEILFFFGLGGSGGVGYLGELLFSHIGYKAVSVIDPYKMIVTAGHADTRSVIIALSHSGRTESVIKAAEIAKGNRACVIGITNYSKSSLAALCDITLLTACHERRIHFAQSDSMVSQITLIRVLYILTASHSATTTVQKVNKIEHHVNHHIRAKT